MQTPYDIGIGVLIFNPEDDTEHLERIEKSISSIVAASNNTDAKTLIMLLMNMSVVGKPQVDGVGPLTKSLVKSYAEKANDKVILKERESPHSMMVNHYAHLQNALHDAVCNKVVVFADDYIVPAKWIDTVLNEFEEFPSADFITPSTNFVPQTNLLVPIKINPRWNTVTYDNNVKGVSSGISQKDVEDLALRCADHPTINYIPPPSFETTIFTKKFLDKYGYVDSRYFSILYNTEYFMKAVLGGAKGYISRKSYIFHYGKGGTAAVAKETRDEKYAGSPLEKYLLEDIKIFNKNTGSSRKKWWGDKPAVSNFLDNHQISLKIKINNYRDIGNRLAYKWFRMRYRIYTSLLESEGISMSFFKYTRRIMEWLPVKMLQPNYRRESRQNKRRLYREMLEKKRNQAIKQHGLEALAKIHELCVANDISYWLYAGTLLATIRENSILLKDDTDIDIGLWYDPNEKQKIEEILTSHGFTKNHHFEVEGNILESRVEYKGVGIDLFYFIKEGLQSYESSFAPIPEVSMNKYYPVRAHYKTEDLVNTKLIRVKGVNLSVPVNPEGVLESLYGDWQTPIPKNESIPYQRPNQTYHKDIQADFIKFSPSVHK